MTTPSKFWVRLRDRKYRKAFVATQVKRGVAFQIRAMRKKLGWTQQELADRSGLPQPSISRAEDLNYGKLTISTLLAIADGFDAALLVRIVPYSHLAQLFDQLSEESVQVATFSEEDAGRDAEGQLLPELRTTRETIEQPPSTNEKPWTCGKTRGARATRVTSSGQIDYGTEWAYGAEAH